ncbi:hypothetical protein RBB50_000362 [Rhinocladiella similis]
MAQDQENGTSNNAGVARIDLHIPPSSTSVTVKVIDIASVNNVPSHALFTPTVKGIDVHNAPSFCFLIEHPSGQKVLFDLAIRKDWENLSPAITERLKKVGHRPVVEKNASELLDESGIGKNSINAVIWSHAHWDHTGDMSTFPGHTDLVVGRGFKDHFLRGVGNSALGGILPSDVKGREVREITFKEPEVVKIGHFPAYDYFKDGSMYLLDSPGHCVGHLCALVRTSTSPDTFVFMGGDAAHHCGEFRPSQYVPLPDTITLKRHHRPVPFCPGAWYDDLQTSRNRDPKGPLWQPSFGHNMEEVMTTIGHVQECDGDDNVFVILAHDPSLRAPSVPMFPNSINDWKSRGLGTELRWTWIGEILSTLEANGERVPSV